MEKNYKQYKEQHKNQEIDTNELYEKEINIIYKKLYKKSFLKDLLETLLIIPYYAIKGFINDILNKIKQKDSK
ncbi:MAG: hypothetical protein KatS3mg129_1412 [Leptospiraceae bacterium]|nr:MAG: hypothetical protein KatS3mg129_1412 [Leptospiraceae bacterium]